MRNRGTDVTLANRYGDPQLEPELERASQTIALQIAHRSVRKFTAEPVSEAEIEAIVAAAQSASTSSNLQAWSVIAVQDSEHKARLAQLANAQQFIDDAPLLLVWIADLSRARRLAARADRRVDAADYLETTLVGVIDVALAAQNALLAAESLGLGGVYVGAIRNHPQEVAAELKLPEHAFAVFGMALGHPDPTEAADVKPRLPRSAVLHRETYDAESADADLPHYDHRLAAYNARFGLAGNWSDRVTARLAGPESMSGRHRLREQLRRLGLPSR